MYLYLVQYTARLGWDEYGAFVIRAEDPGSAKRQAAAVAKDQDPTAWKARRIGTADAKRPGIVLDSFSAG